MDDLRAWWLREMVRTPGPLREVMTLFWHGHFTSSYRKVLISQSMYEQNALFRRHALGNFRRLLNAVLRDSAMMLYLDMEEMTGERHNENLARELCELFTLGVGNYSEADVREIARALTGWTLDVPAGVVKPNRPDAPRLHRALRRDGLVARFVPERHDGGTKTILGRSGAFGLHDVADILVAHPLPPGSWRAGSSPSSGRAIRNPHSLRGGDPVVDRRPGDAGRAGRGAPGSPRAPVPARLGAPDDASGPTAWLSSCRNGTLGTDHGSASAMLLAGGSVVPGLHGGIPDLDDLDDGDVRHRVDFRAVYASVLRQWFGVDPDPVLFGHFEPVPLLRV